MAGEAISSPEKTVLGLQSMVRLTGDTGRERRGWGTHRNREKRAGNNRDRAALHKTAMALQACDSARVGYLGSSRGGACYRVGGGAGSGGI